AALAKVETGAVSSDLAKVAEGSQEAMQRVAAASPAWDATLRTTCVATQLEGGHAKNALPQLAGATVNCRVLPEDSVGYVTALLKRVIAETAVTLTIDGTPKMCPASPMRDDLMTAIKSVTASLWPGVPA